MPLWLIIGGGVLLVYWWVGRDISRHLMVTPGWTRTIDNRTALDGSVKQLYVRDSDGAWYTVYFGPGGQYSYAAQAMGKGSELNPLPAPAPVSI